MPLKGAHTYIAHQEPIKWQYPPPPRHKQQKNDYIDEFTPKKRECINGMTPLFML